MDVFRGDMLEQSPLNESIALSIGNFDGVHKGHVHLINQLKSRAKAKNLKTALLTFDPHPNEVLNIAPVSGSLQTQEHKIESLRELGVDILFIQNFSPTFAELKREDFLRQYVMHFFQPQFLLLGYDFRFGRGVQGDFHFAKSFLGEVDVEQATRFEVEGVVLSSSRIRSSLKESNVHAASQGLGYSYSIKGRVVRGQSIGQTIGFPTANLENVETILPGCGVYAGFGRIEGEVYPAVLNIGQRPTVESGGKISCECHLIGFSGEIYDQTLKFEFVDRLRFEQKFENLEELKKQIAADIVAAKKILEIHEP